MRLQPVSGPLVILLCIFSFLFGRFTQQGAQLPEPVQLGTARRLGSVVEDTSSIQALETNPVEQKSVAVVESPAPVPQSKVIVNPLDPVELSTWCLESSGLLKLRPPLPAAASGSETTYIIPFQILSWYPRIVVFPGFIDKARAEHIVKLAGKFMYPSGLAYRPGEQVENSQQTRTSTGTFLSSGMDTEGVLGWVEHRIAAATLLPADNGEAFNVLHYEHMQHYDSHMDSFDPKDFGPQPSQRIATVLLYLSEVLEGGETVFKKEGVDGADRPIQDWRNCDDGSFKYAPRMGDAVLFWGTLPNGDIDPHSLHGGCPVKKGEKWVATKWIRSRGAMGY
ncbi:hypothetical protein HXX76_000831 [Chlamydomonas incerta]|uniref:Fe2OG dioxygenase domain-containing protein n=1 Tax=Chlamydomonas incerta TaxID=51695 RepID=A0A835WFC2_CHLIN|nr:hypothetical protein HXX76_000831 [Chlamydomonas incerta]|eukprot:KAG2446239.1 hypothetical protein HXX76_000831 [Chlamydomonas incerta]